MLGYANSIRTIDGGTHIEGVKASLTRTLNSLAKKLKVIKVGYNLPTAFFPLYISTLRGLEPFSPSLFLLFHGNCKCLIAVSWSLLWLKESSEIM